MELMCVNALHRAYPISTELFPWNSGKKIRVSMPYIGLIPFLLFYLFRMAMQCFCVNALHRAYPISTAMIGKEIIKMTLCQCPTSGLSHFYLQISRLYYIDPISVSMPYIGLIPFLRYGYDIRVLKSKLCQCPTSGLSHFYCTL